MDPLSRTGVEAATAYLTSRNALHKLAEPVSCLMGNPRHGEALRRQRKAPTNLHAWLVLPFGFLGLNHR